MCHYLGGGLHGRQKRVKAQSESSKSVVNSVLISREMPVFPGFLEIIRVVMGNINTTGQQTAVINEGVTILTASRSDETSKEVDGHGVFTSLLIEALSGSAADVTGHITPGGIYAYIDKALGPWEQRPVFKTNVTRFTSLRNVTPQVDLSIIRRLCDYFTNEDEELQIDPSYEPTNSPYVAHEVVKPYANEEHTRIFSDLQKLEGIGLVVPVGEEHMYYAAMKSKSCALTAIGKQYWRLVKGNRI